MKKIKGLLYLALPSALLLGMDASQASTYGTLSNFDVYNDNNGAVYYGFEIELDGINQNQIWQTGNQPYTYTNAHYGAGQVSTDALGNTHIKYFKSGVSTAAWNGAITATGGHACISIAGCEHFGTVLTGNPTATHYYWLDQSGNAVTSNPVSLLAPVTTVVQPAQPAQPAVPAQPAAIQVVMQAPEKPENEPVNQEFGDAFWVKVYKTEAKANEKSQLDDLMADNPNKIADASDGAAETEWKLFQRHNTKPDDVKNKLDTGEQNVGLDSEQVLRTYLFYKFTGTYDPESHEAICADGVVGGCEDYIQNTNDTQNVGHLIGQQMVAFDLNLADVAAVPLPGAVWLFGSALVYIGANARTRKKSLV